MPLPRDDIPSSAPVGPMTPPSVLGWPAFGQLPRVKLGSFPTPLESLEVVAPGLWVKREDLSAEPLGGNKIRSLEFLLGAVRAGDRVTTVGSAGSTHVLATTIYARRLGAEPVVFRWRQEMNATAREVAARIERELGYARVSRTVVGAYGRALVARIRGAHWIPAGGSSPLGVLGHVEAGAELAMQVAAGSMPRPDRIVVALGTGGTTAGLALGAAIGGLNTEIVAVRVVPRIVANERHVARLINRTTRLMHRLTGAVLAPVPVRVMHQFYGGAYGRATPSAEQAAELLRSRCAISADATYSAKALAAAIAISKSDGGTTLFWLSFDARWLDAGNRVAIG